MTKRIFQAIFILLGLFFCFSGTSRLYSQNDQPGPDTVKIGCYIISLHDFNFREKEYTARFWLWMLYDSPDIDFHDDVEIPNAKNITFDELVEDSTNGKKWVQMKITASMKETWSVRDYPFDEQKLMIIVENSKYDARTVIFSPEKDGQYYDPNFVVQGWTINKFDVSTGTSHYATGFGDASLEKPESDYSKFVIEIHLERNAWGLFLKLFLGMYVAFAISIAAFWVGLGHSESRFALPVGGLFAAVGNKYIIDSYLPESSAFTTVDILHGITFISIFITILFGAIAIRMEDRGEVEQVKKLDKRVRLIMGITFIILNASVIIHSIYD
jgi:hypothetical protein